MELMSSLLLCALVALLPRTSDSSPVLEPEFKIKNTKMVDLKCAKCINCMERALKAHKTQTYVHNIPDTEEMPNDVIDSYQLKTFRIKRAAAKVSSITNTTKAKKSKNTKKSKGVTVTKFNTDGQLYALKITEPAGDAAGRESTATCQVYSVKKYFPCGTPEGDLLLTTSKRRSKKSKKDQSKKTLTTEKPKNNSTRTQVSRTIKREVGTSNSRILEQYMTSIEELY